MLRYQSALATRVHVAFTSTAEGNLAFHVPDDRDAVLLRRRDLERGLGLGESRFRYMNQVHSATVVEITGEQLEPQGPTCDALVSATAAVPLAVMVADCVPVVLVGISPRGALSAVAHAGRRGLLDGILTATVERLRSAGATSLEAWIGPAICGSCYEVPESMASEANILRPGIVTTTHHGTTGLDLPGAAATELLDLGVVVSETGICTLEDENYFSYRRDSQTGRLAGLVWQDVDA